eukprot:TRINITY_DN1621_c0_g1_i5.p1 TRINITY_DN1621_c0_g1~~TRINITY_DN1621_c0_g1_i5.p1  ORF type:complete len:206 (-),score=60.26 TRINITY_DN1621_c0_g1_i5:66-683(-)
MQLSKGLVVLLPCLAIVAAQTCPMTGTGGDYIVGFNGDPFFSVGRDGRCTCWHGPFVSNTTTPTGSSCNCSSAASAAQLATLNATLAASAAQVSTLNSTVAASAATVAASSAQLSSLNATMAASAATVAALQLQVAQLTARLDAFASAPASSGSPPLQKSCAAYLQELTDKYATDIATVHAFTAPINAANEAAIGQERVPGEGEE